jgi:hypothetical protein
MGPLAVSCVVLGGPLLLEDASDSLAGQGIIIERWIWRRLIPATWRAK